MDSLTPERRSWNMSKIRSKDTKIEIMVRRFLFANGFRFRKNDKRYPGKPDVLLPKYKTAIFVNGCFWHMHDGCKQGRLPKTNIEFWREKLERNVRNDNSNIKQLRNMGWHTITLWECELKKDFVNTMEKVVEELKVFDPNKND